MKLRVFERPPKLACSSLYHISYGVGLAYQAYDKVPISSTKCEFDGIVTVRMAAHGPSRPGFT